MKYYKIELTLSEDNLDVLTEALKTYNGSKRIIAYTIIELIKRQTEIQKEYKKN